MNLSIVNRGRDYFVKTIVTLPREFILQVDDQYYHSYSRSFLSLLDSSDTESLQYLLQLGCAIRSDQRTGNSLLHRFVSIPFQQILIQYGADIHCTNEKGQTPLHLAVKNGEVEYCLYLLEKGARNDRDNRGRNVKDYLRWYNYLYSREDITLLATKMATA